jgi:hypothetical protein
MKVESGRALSWSEIDLAPETSGVYAWYSRLAIAKADIEGIIKRVEAAKQHNEAAARAEVEGALERFIFGPYREAPYQVLLRGALKPKYGGDISHEPTKSERLVARLVQDPTRIRVIADILKGAAPWFTAPLYIGMASNLRNRLRQHKQKIVDLRDTWSSGRGDDAPEAGFANQVVARNFDPTNLFVHVAEVDVDGGEYNDIENILNRINYPIFGRN